MKNYLNLEEAKQLAHLVHTWLEAPYIPNDAIEAKAKFKSIVYDSFKDWANITLEFQTYDAWFKGFTLASAISALIFVLGQIWGSK